ncbi:DNA-3-methyladenine glycosylase I [Vibrio sp. SS-MA-C1-2]|uniref:DNA-3-methyladenine glycosylase I n=1 Tax=Vibrio sp. SS-MA-C1-2 TaxID=2908646 RepID=UPI001F2F0EB9|nr:DNA-3-methyladenine glycosylase I [Vibrio sp. SS-MA-C1-2]UJF18158.1 DNA-3-methyladenine glycosylase I [Vibrio sp. SS-MA-C1-2]
MAEQKIRCPWLDLSKEDYVHYHDTEWGVPIYDDQTLFEYLTLESAQAGLSWYTILKKRENYRTAFANFDPIEVAEFDQEKVEELLQNSGIVRHRQKINAAIHNAKLVLEIQKEHGSLSDFLWGFVDHKVIIRHSNTLEDYQVATTPESDKLFKALKKRGFKFLGSTTVYAFMQACGMVNDHSKDCYRRNQVVNKSNN